MIVIVIKFIIVVVLLWDLFLNMVCVVKFVWYKLVFVVVYFVIIIMINFDKFNVWNVMLFGLSFIIDFCIIIVVLVFMMFVEIYVI